MLFRSESLLNLTLAGHKNILHQKCLYCDTSFLTDAYRSSHREIRCVAVIVYRTRARRVSGTSESLGTPRTPGQLARRNFRIVRKLLARLGESGLRYGLSSSAKSWATLLASCPLGRAGFVSIAPLPGAGGILTRMSESSRHSSTSKPANPT